MADNIPSLDDLLKSIQDEGKPQSSSALAVVPKKPDDLVEEDIDPRILAILGLEDIFDLTYEEYYSLLKEAAVKGRMPGSQMTTESIELITNELKRVKGKTGRFKVKQKKVDINKVLDRREPSSAIVKAQKLIPPAVEVAPEQKEKVKIGGEDVQEDLINGIGRILDSLVEIRTVLNNQKKIDNKKEETERKEREKKKKKQRESLLESAIKPVQRAFKALTKPFTSFFDTIKNFFMSILVGSALNFLLAVIKDPSIIMNPLRGLVNSIVNFLNGIVNFLWNLVVSPINFVINGLNAGIQNAINAINSVTRLIGISPIKVDPIKTIPTQAPIQIPNWNAPVQQQSTGGEVINVGDITFNKGGSITNNSGVTVSGFGKDTRLIAAEPGEVMMSNKAGDFWGRDNLLAMNAMAGGTNKPKIGKAGIAAMTGGGLVSMSQSQLPPLPPTNTLPGKQHYGAPREGGRKHAGVDFDAPDNGTFYSRIGGEVIYSNNAGGGYGNVVDIYNKTLNVTERIAEGTRNLVRLGQKINPGTPVQQGTHQTGVFHYEIREGRATGSGSFEGTLDPIAFLRGERVKGVTYDPSIAELDPSKSPSAPAVPAPPPGGFEGNLSDWIQKAFGYGAPASPSADMRTQTFNNSSVSGNQYSVPHFSSRDLNSPTSIVVKSIYNLVD